MKRFFVAGLAVIVGMVVALLLVIAVELFSAVVYPVPADFTGTMEEMCLHVARYPHWILAVAVAAWSSTAFISTWVAARIGGRVAGVTVATLLAAAIVCNVTQLPYTMWFKVVMLSCFPVACYCGVRSGARVSRAAGGELVPPL